MNSLFFVIELCSLYTLDIISLFDRWFSKVFSLTVLWLFVLLMIPFALQTPLSLMQSHLLICCLHFWCHIQNITANIDKLLSYINFFPRSFMVSGLVLKSFIHSELIFVSDVRQECNFIVPFIPNLPRVFIMKDCYILCNAFSASIEIIMWFYFSFYLHDVLQHTDLHMLNCSCIWEINLTCHDE